METKKKLTVKTILAWIVGVVLLLTGIVTIFNEPLSGIFFILSSLLIIPTTYNLLSKNLNLDLSRSLRVLIVIILLALSAGTSGSFQTSLETNTEVSEETSNIIEEEVTEDIVVKEKPASAPAVTIKENSYQEVFTFNGQDVKKSEPFTVSGSRFKVKYNCPGELCIAWVNKTAGQFSNTLIMNSEGPLSDETIIYGSGEYYIDVMGMGSWSFTVEDYK
jgi:hypothetical protein